MTKQELQALLDATIYENTNREITATSLNSLLSTFITEMGLQVDLDTKIPYTDKGVANGVAPLDGTGVIPLEFIPGDINEIDVDYETNKANWVADPKKLILTNDTLKLYWNPAGTPYEISANAILTVNGKQPDVNKNVEINIEDIPQLRETLDTPPTLIKTNNITLHNDLSTLVVSSGAVNYIQIEYTANADFPLAGLLFYNSDIPDGTQLRIVAKVNNNIIFDQIFTANTSTAAIGGFFTEVIFPATLLTKIGDVGYLFIEKADGSSFQITSMASSTTLPITVTSFVSNVGVISGVDFVVNDIYEGIISELTLDANGDPVVDVAGSTKLLAYKDLSNVSDTDILNKVKNVDGVGSGLDADTLQGLPPSNFANATDLTAHTSDTNNPHNVTTAQIGALPQDYLANYSYLPAMRSGIVTQTAAGIIKIGLASNGVNTNFRGLYQLIVYDYGGTDSPKYQIINFWFSYQYLRFINAFGSIIIDTLFVDGDTLYGHMNAGADSIGFTLVSLNKEYNSARLILDVVPDVTGITQTTNSIAIDTGYTGSVDIIGTDATGTNPVYHHLYFRNGILTSYTTS